MNRPSLLLVCHATRGYRRVVAVPLVLSAPSHAKSDIPAALARERARHPGLECSYGRPLGPHPVLPDLLRPGASRWSWTE